MRKMFFFSPFFFYRFHSNRTDSKLISSEFKRTCYNQSDVARVHLTVLKCLELNRIDGEKMANVKMA